MVYSDSWRLDPAANKPLLAAVTSPKPHLSCSILIFIVSSSETCVSSSLHLLEPLRSIFSPGRSSLRCFPNLAHKHKNNLNKLNKRCSIFFFIISLSQLVGIECFAHVHWRRCISGSISSQLKEIHEWLMGTGDHRTMSREPFAII